MKTLQEAAEDYSEAVRAFGREVARAFGIYKILDWMLRWYPQRRPSEISEIQAGDANVPEHVEARCGRCGGPNRPWSAPSPLWNLVMRGGTISGTEPYDGIICPTCFMILAGDTAELWRLDAQRVRGVMETSLPDGRTWDAKEWLWRVRVIKVDG